MMIVVALFLLFVLVPLAELTLLLIIAEMAGHWWVSLLIVITTGFLGAVLARQQGSMAWRRLVTQTRAGQLPTDAILDSALILVAGTLLITPGVLTDLVGVTLLIPWSRSRIRERIKRWGARRFQIDTAVMSQESRVVDSYVVDSPSRGDNESQTVD